MSTYFISDIHGEYELFMKLLKEITFKDEDVIYILGDMIDKGNDSIKLIRYISRQPNMVAIMGNHEYAFCEYAKGVFKNYSIKDNKLILRKLQNYFSSNNEILLDNNDIEYIFNLPYYIRTDDFICVHAGLEIVNNKILPLNVQNYKYFLFDRNFKTANFEPINKTILFGHTPCCYDQIDGRFIKTRKTGNFDNNFSSYSKIRLDTGVGFTKMLGVLRKEDMKEIYVKAK